MLDRDPTLQPDLGAVISALEARIRTLERAPRYYGQVVTAVPLGAVRDFGFSSIDSTSYTEVFRADAWLTAPVLDYDLQISDAYSTSTPTSIEWRLEVTDEHGTATVVASGTGTGTDQFAGTVDLADTIGAQLLYRPIRIDIEIKRTGGTGDAAIRQVRPFIIRP